MNNSLFVGCYNCDKSSKIILTGADIVDSKKIGAFIAMNRKKKGLTQEQLGEKLGVSNKTISRWENGNYMPDLSLLNKIYYHNFLDFL